MFDKSKKYYKIFNEADCHNGFQYKDGLNIDSVPFNDDPIKLCVSGGFYFSDADHICEFLDYGIYIRELSIPEYANIFKYPNDDIWRSDKLFLHERRDLRNVDTWEWMVEQGINIHTQDDYALRWAAENGHFDIVKFLIENKSDIHACNDYALRWARINKHKEIIEYLEEKMKES